MKTEHPSYAEILHFWEYLKRSALVTKADIETSEVLKWYTPLPDQDIVYFVERKDTNEWYYPTLERLIKTCQCSDCVPPHKVDRRTVDGWTKDPEEAMAYATQDSAQSAIDFYHTNEMHDNLMVTSHIFIKEEKKPDMRGPDPYFEPTVRTWNDPLS